jgi:hypothetical protein
VWPARPRRTRGGSLTPSVLCPYAVDGTKATLQFTVIYVSVKVHAYSHTSRVVSSRAPCRLSRVYVLYTIGRGLISRGLSRSSDSTPTGAAPRARARARRVAVGRGACAARGLVHIESTLSAHSMRGSGTRQEALRDFATSVQQANSTWRTLSHSERGLRPPDELKYTLCYYVYRHAR